MKWHFLSLSLSLSDVLQYNQDELTFFVFVFVFVWLARCIAVPPRWSDIHCMHCDAVEFIPKHFQEMFTLWKVKRVQVAFTPWGEANEKSKHQELRSTRSGKSWRNFDSRLFSFSDKPSGSGEASEKPHSLVHVLPHSFRTHLLLLQRWSHTAPSQSFLI